MVATKEQELKTLEKIKKIVEELGEGSYIGMAFEGCFEIAEENIRNDFGCSMKQKAEKAEKDAKYFQEIASSLSNDIEKVQKENDRLRKKVLTEMELARVANLVAEKRITFKEAMERAAKQIVDNAEKPGGEIFKTAVGEHKRAKELMKVYQELSEKINFVLEE